MKQAGIVLDDIDLFEYHDVFSIYAALQLEAVGFAARGQRLETRRGWRDRLEGQNPLCHHGRDEGARISRRRCGRVPGCRSSHPAAGSGRGEPDPEREDSLDPVTRRTGINSSQSHFAEAGLSQWTIDHGPSMVYRRWSMVILSRSGNRDRGQHRCGSKEQGRNQPARIHQEILIEQNTLNVKFGKQNGRKILPGIPEGGKT